MLDLVETHIRGQGFHVVREDPDLETRLRHPRIVKVLRERRLSGGAHRHGPSRVAGDRRRRREAARASLDAELVPPLGGSLPLHHFTLGLGKPIVIVPVANHDNNQHAADENLRAGEPLVRDGPVRGAAHDAVGGSRGAAGPSSLRSSA